MPSYPHTHSQGCVDVKIAAHSFRHRYTKCAWEFVRACSSHSVGNSLSTDDVANGPTEFTRRRYPLTWDFDPNRVHWILCTMRNIKFRSHSSPRAMELSFGCATSPTSTHRLPSPGDDEPRSSPPTCTALRPR